MFFVQLGSDRNVCKNESKVTTNVLPEQKNFFSHGLTKLDLFLKHVLIPAPNFLGKLLNKILLLSNSSGENVAFSHTTKRIFNLQFFCKISGFNKFLF